jgi:tetratricopeptide (TPR) repeat protein
MDNDKNPRNLIKTAKGYLLNITATVREKNIEVIIKQVIFSLYVFSKLNKEMFIQERKEFQELFERAIHLISLNKYIKQLNIIFDYKYGKEHEMFNVLRSLPPKLNELYNKQQDEEMIFECMEKMNRLTKAKRLYETRKFDGALSQFTKLLNEYPDDYDTINEMADVLFKSGHIESITFLERCIELNPTAVHNYSRLGQVLRKTKKHDRAIELYNQAIEIEPNNYALWFNLGRIHIELGHWEDSRRCMRRVLELKPELKEAELALSFSSKHLKDY